jgi:hypothetical protein
MKKLVLICIVLLGMAMAGLVVFYGLLSFDSTSLERIASRPDPGEARAYVRANNLGSNVFDGLQEGLDTAMTSSALPGKHINPPSHYSVSTLFGSQFNLWERAYPMADDFDANELLEELRPTLQAGDWPVGSIVMGIRHRPSDAALPETETVLDVAGAFIRINPGNEKDGAVD